MDANSFQQLSTNKVNWRCQPYMDAIYRSLLPGCGIQRNPSLHEDRDLGIDVRIVLPQQSILTVQEKCREFNAFHYFEFTQEFMNAVGTPYEAPGEWFKLTANLYFYGWETLNQCGFHSWFILDVLKYKLLVEQAGGLQRIGLLKNNSKHGKASFYAIPVRKLEPAVWACSWQKAA